MRLGRRITSGTAADPPREEARPEPEPAATEAPAPRREPDRAPVAVPAEH